MILESTLFWDGNETDYDPQSAVQCNEIFWCL